MKAKQAKRKVAAKRKQQKQAWIDQKAKTVVNRAAPRFPDALNKGLARGGLKAFPVVGSHIDALAHYKSMVGVFGPGGPLGEYSLGSIPRVLLQNDAFSVFTPDSSRRSFNDVAEKLISEVDAFISIHPTKPEGPVRYTEIKMPKQRAVDAYSKKHFVYTPQYPDPNADPLPRTVELEFSHPASQPITGQRVFAYPDAAGNAGMWVITYTEGSPVRTVERMGDVLEDPTPLTFT